MPKLMMPGGLFTRVDAEAFGRPSSVDTRGVRAGEGIFDCGAEKLIAVEA